MSAALIAGARHNCVQEVVASSKPAIICLQENRLVSVSSVMLLSTVGAVFDQFVTLPASGLSGIRGKIVIAWRGSICRATGTRVDSYSASVRYTLEDGQGWWWCNKSGWSSLGKAGFQLLTPSQHEVDFQRWWRKASR